MFHILVPLANCEAAGNHWGRAGGLEDTNNMAQSNLLTVALTSDDETKTTAYNMGCGLIAIDQYDPETRTINTITLAEQDLAQLRNMIA